MSAEIRMDADVLEAHGRRISRLADDIDTALSAGRSVDLGGGAFGVLCGWMIPPSATLSAVLVAQMSEVRSALSRTEGELTAVVRDFSEQEDANVRTFEWLGSLQ